MREASKQPLHLVAVAPVAAALAALLAPAVGYPCGVHGTNAGNDINDWFFGDTDQDGLAEAFIGVEDLFVPPVMTTTCVCGIGLGTSNNRFPPSSQVTGARIAVVNVATRAIADLGAFAFSANVNTTAGLASGAGPGGPAGTNPLFEGAAWFGFAATVDPFVLPVLAPGEIFALGFDLTLPVADLPLAVEVQFAAGEGDASGNPLFFGAHPPGYFSVDDPIAVLAPEPGGAARALGGLGIPALLARRRRTAASLGSRDGRASSKPKARSLQAVRA